jgi:hypothetical protein
MESVDGFPLAQFERVVNELLKPFVATRPSGSLQPLTDAEIRWSEFAGGSNGARWRFRGCIAHDEALKHLFTSDSQRYDEERELFDFFLNGMSSIECACYALYMIGGMFNAVEFPVNPKTLLRKIYPRRVLSKFKTAFSTDVITSFLAASFKSPQYTDWEEKRIVLFHRAAPPRQMHVGGSPTPDLWQFGEGDLYDRVYIPSLRTDAYIKRGSTYEPLTPDLSGDRRRWLANWHAGFWTNTVSFCEAYV